MSLTATAPARTVFFDLDDTLLHGNSANLFIKYLLRRGELGWLDVVRGFYYTAHYKLNRIDIGEVTAQFCKRYDGVLEASLVEQCEEWFRDHVRPVIYPGAVELIESHRSQGDRLVLLTASTIYACMPIARHLRFDHYIGTRLVVEEGKFTGLIEHPLCYGPGKLARAKAYLMEAGHTGDLERATFYTDSITDLPMLEAVGDPQVVNPDPLLAREAKRRGWPVRRFSRSRG